MKLEVFNFLISLAFLLYFALCLLYLSLSKAFVIFYLRASAWDWVALNIALSSLCSRLDNLTFSLHPMCAFFHYFCCVFFSHHAKWVSPLNFEFNLFRELLNSDKSSYLEVKPWRHCLKICQCFLFCLPFCHAGLFLFNSAGYNRLLPLWVQ